MIYRYHVCDKPIHLHQIATDHYQNALSSVLVNFPNQLLRLLDYKAEAHNELMMKNNQEAYLKITSNETEDAVLFAVQSLLKLSGLEGTRLN